MPPVSMLRTGSPAMRQEIERRQPQGLPQPELPPHPQYKHRRGRVTRLESGLGHGTLVPSGPRSEKNLGDHGHARAAFRRAIERGNLVVAEIEAREIGQLDLGEALELTALVALRKRERGRRYAVRWLQRWLDDAEAPTIDEAVMVAGCLAALGGPWHLAALEALRGLCVRPLHARA
jgi:hypothetical protein